MKRPRFIRWLAPGLNIKRWLFLFSLGVAFFLFGAALLVDYRSLSYLEDLLLELLYTTTGAYDYATLVLIGTGVIGIGFAFMLLGMRKVIKTVVGAVVSDEERGVSDYIFDNIRLGQGPKLVVIGGGTGLSVLLRGLKERTSNLTAVVTVADDGGSSGRLREDFNMIAPGDLRNCLVALAEKEGLMETLFRYRFEGDNELAGHSFGNLFLAGLTQVLDDDIEKALDASSKILKVRGRVIPSSVEDLRLSAELTDGSVIEGESRIPDGGMPIRRVFLTPESPKPVGAALQAIDEADAIIIGPGSLYTSIMPNVLVDKIADHIRASRAPKIYICNVMTQPGETDGYRVSDHVQAIARHGGMDLITTVLVNDTAIDADVLDNYRRTGAEPVEIDADTLERMGIRVIRADLVDSRDKAVHNADRLGKVIMDIVYALETDIEPHILEYYLRRQDH